MARATESKTSKPKARKSAVKKVAGDSATAPDARMLRALAHPMRLEILSILNERTASPNGLATELDAPVGVVAYHVRYLRDLDALELVDTKPRRGAVEHFYKAKIRPWFTEEEFQGLPAKTRRSASATQVRRVVDDAVAALGHGGFDGETAHAAFAAPLVDERGAGELHALLQQTLTKVAAIENSAASRAAKAKEDTRTPYEVAVLGFSPAPRAKGRAKRG